MWFLKPIHTAESVARQILEGLEDGTIYLDDADVGSDIEENSAAESEQRTRILSHKPNECSNRDQPPT